MPATVASSADERSTARAFAVSSALLVTNQRIDDVDVLGLDPFPTTFPRTIEAILGGVFLVFSVPLHFEFRVEELLDVIQGNVVGRATFRGHVLRVCEREGEDAAEAGVAHTVGACEAGGARGGIGRETGEAFDPVKRRLEEEGRSDDGNIGSISLFLRWRGGTSDPNDGAQEAGGSCNSASCHRWCRFRPLSRS